MTTKEKKWLDACKIFFKDDVLNHLKDECDKVDNIDDMKKLVERAKSFTSTYVSDANFYINEYYELKK